MFKKTILSALLLGSSVSAMADVVPLQFDVVAHIPAETAYVVATGGWDSYMQRMNWDPSSGVLNNLNRQIEAKNTGGAINAYLESSAELIQIQGTERIPLKVTIAGFDIKNGATNSTEILSDTEAAAGRTLSLGVAQDTIKLTTLKPGDYQGVINLTFDFS